MRRWERHARFERAGTGDKLGTKEIENNKMRRMKF